MRLLLGITIFALLAALPAFAHTPAEGKVWGTVGPMAYRTGSNSVLASEEPNVGGGVVAEGDVDQNGGVEIAMFYIDKLYLRRLESGLLAERIKRMYITTGYRHWFTPWISTALAFFSSYSMGDVRIIAGKEGPGPGDHTTARQITEYGADFSLEWEVWGDENTNFVIDGRYSKSMTAKRDERADLYGMLFGVTYLIPKTR